MASQTKFETNNRITVSSMSNTHNRDNTYIQNILSDDKPLKINAIKSCIEADEAITLLEIIDNNFKAKIYYLITCFTFIPPVKCIELLIAEGTPLNQSFENNPFQCTPQEYLDKHFNITSNKLQTKSRNAIYQAIERGKIKLKNKEHITIPINLPDSVPPISTLKRVGNILLSPLSKKL